MGIKSRALGTERKPTFGRKRTTNDEELKYINWVKQQGLRCFICGGGNTELHHIKERSTDKKNHYELLPLCTFHHTGCEISPHGAKKAFFDLYPIEVQKEFAKEIYNNYKEII